jgi:hypothetical protein
MRKAFLGLEYNERMRARSKIKELGLASGFREPTLAYINEYLFPLKTPVAPIVPQNEAEAILFNVASTDLQSMRTAINLLPAAVHPNILRYDPSKWCTDDLALAFAADTLDGGDMLDLLDRLPVRGKTGISSATVEKIIDKSPTPTAALLKILNRFPSTKDLISDSIAYKRILENLSVEDRLTFVQHWAAPIYCKPDMATTFLVSQGLLSDDWRPSLTALVEGNHPLTFIKLLCTWHNVLLTQAGYTWLETKIQSNKEKDAIMEYLASLTVPSSPKEENHIYC